MFPSIFTKWLAMTHNLFKDKVISFFNNRGTEKISVIDPDTDQVVDVEVPTIREVAAQEANNILDDKIVDVETTFTSRKIYAFDNDYNKVINYVFLLYSYSGLFRYAIADMGEIIDHNGTFETDNIRLDQNQYAIFKIDLTNLNLNFNRFISTIVPAKNADLIYEYSLDGSTYYGFNLYEIVSLNNNTSVIYFRITNTSINPAYISYLIINYK